MASNPSTPAACSLNSSQAILAAADLPATIRFYREVLGFESHWTWGDPPTFAGLRWGAVRLMFGLDPQLAAKVDGHQHSFFTDDVNALHDLHQRNGAPILSPIENKPWHIREYTVRDPNGNHLRFGGPTTQESGRTAAPIPDFIRFVERLPTLEEFSALKTSVGWNIDLDVSKHALANSLYGLVALDERARADAQVVGTLRIVGDGARFFYIQDVMVTPDLQGQRIGTAMMNTAMAWLRRTASKGSMVALFTGRPTFYERHGFRSGSGMSLFL